MSFQISDPAATTATLRHAILLYGSNNVYGHGVRYATVHPVTVDEDGRAQIREGQPLDRGSLVAFAQGLMTNNFAKGGVLPANVISVGQDHVAWWSPPSQRTYFFKTRLSEKDDMVGVRTGKAFAPGLLFAVKNKRMFVYAVRGKDRPTADTPLHLPPLMNCYDDGRVCTGSMALPEQSTAATIQKWEDSFWQSAFTHPNGAKMVKYKGGLHRFSKDLLDGKFRKFPERYLVPYKTLTVGDFISTLEGVEA